MKVYIEIMMTSNGLVIGYEMNCELNYGLRKWLTRWIINVGYLMMWNDVLWIWYIVGVIMQ
jgi:hypothetical protein